MKKHIYLLGCILALYGCSNSNKYQNEEVFSLKDFKSTQMLSGSTVVFDTSAMKPIKLQVYDSLLLTINIGEEKHINVFNLNTKKKIGERITLGQGYNEMLQPSFIKDNKNQIGIFDIATSSIFEFPTDEFIHNNNPLPQKKGKLNKQVFSDISLLSKSIISSAYNEDYPFYKFNLDGDSIGSIGSYPISKIEYTRKERNEAFQCTFTTNAENKMAICYSWTDLIDIYNAEGKLEKRLHGPIHFFPHFKEFQSEGTTMARPEKGKQRDAYFNPVSVENNFFVLFNGKLVDEEGYSMLATQIFVFNWDGTPEQILSLDQGIFTFSVDPKNKIIYGISDSPEFHIIEFHYK